MNTFDFEWKILDFFDSFKSNILNIINQYFSNIFGSIGLVIIFLLIYWIVNKDKGLKIGFSLITSMLFNNLIKGFVNRKRPFETPGKEYLRKLDVTKDHATGTSFPSGHSMNSASLYSSVICNFRQKRYLALQIICSVIIVLVGITRIYLGVHFPTDVLVGILLGILIAILFTFLQDFFGDKKWILYIIVSLVFLPCLFFDTFGKDFIKSYGLVVGFTIGHLLERKYVDFNAVCSPLKKILRVIIGLVFVGGAYLVYSIVPDPIHSNFFFVFGMHILISFLGVFIVPLIFTLIEKPNYRLKNNIL